MKTLCLLVALLITANCQIVPQSSASGKCMADYIMTQERLCIKSCSHPDFAKCGDVFPALWNPSFCALNKNGQWQSFTYACQACGGQNKNFVGVADGSCDSAPIKRCASDQLSTKRGCIKACSSPSFKQCGDIFPALYNPSFCALSKIGVWSNFTFECQACTNNYLNSNYDGVQAGACPVCKQNQIFTEEKGCVKSCSAPEFAKCGDVFPALFNPSFCALNKKGGWSSFTFACQACTNNFENSDWLAVADGACNGSEPEVQPEPQCRSDSQCQAGEGCMDGVCVNKCAAVSCLAPSTCFDGKCSIPTTPVPQCRVDGQCKAGQSCSNGVCVNKCAAVLCLAPSTCFDGKCSVPNNTNTCKLSRDCKSLQLCLNGTCVSLNQLCGGGICKSGQKCVYNKCIVQVEDTLKLDVCPTGAKYAVKNCTTRPDDKSCPLVNYFRQPDPLVCGVKADGSRVNFPRECDACKDKTIQYYFDVPCHKAPFVCGKGQTCQGFYCKSSGCKNSEQCPYDWQTCAEGKCIDRCALLRCASGSCKFGQCAYQEASGSCTLGSSSGCKNDSWSCVGFECADLCLKKACPANYNCNSKSGECEKQKI